MPSFHYEDFAEKNTAFLYIVSRIKICKKKYVDVLSIANAFEAKLKQKHRM